MSLGIEKASIARINEPNADHTVYWPTEDARRMKIGALLIAEKPTLARSKSISLRQ